MYILPKYRLGIGFLRLWDEAKRLLRSQGISWSMSRISAFNRVSLASHGKLGTQVVGSVMFLHLGRMQLALASIRPRFHLSFGPARIPQYVLRAPKVERKSWL